MKRKLFSLCLALVMILSLMPELSLATFAAETSGTCGENLTWKFDETTGTLTISGTGEMDSWWEPQITGLPSWYDDYREDIVAVEIKEGVTSIGCSAFYGCTHLNSVTIPETVTSIGRYAFLNTPFSETVKDKNGFTIVNGMLADYSGSDNNVLIPNGVTTIGDWALSFCDGTNITIPDSVTNVGDYAFHRCYNLTNVHIPDSVTSIGECAFSVCESLTSVTLPYGLDSIGLGAFSYCSNLTSITLPESIISIGDGAFFECTSLSEVVFTGDAPFMDAYTFDNVTAIIYYPANNATWTEEVMHNYGGDITWIPYIPEAVIGGDSSGDGEINNVDAMLILQYSVGLKEQDEICYDACDVNGDGAVNNVDAMMILQFSVGLITEFKK